MTSTRCGSKEVPVYRDVDSEQFAGIQATNEPALLKGCNFGDCTARWTLDYLRGKLDAEQVVSVHESGDKRLEFIEKNFRYKNRTISEFLDELEAGSSVVYLRSTNRDPRAKKAARIEEDFPTLADDLQPPKFIPFGGTNSLYHSSVLRIASSGVQIWTHFDLYDNALLQIVGTKRVVLIPPEDTQWLYIKGDKSPVNEFDDWNKCLNQFPLVKNARLYECLLEPGDCLYIPSLWWHNIRTLDAPVGHHASVANYSLGLNIFWQDQAIASDSLYAGNDVYGNKNLVPFEAATNHLDKFFQQLNKLPGKYRTLYKVMFMERIEREFAR